jgi:hypothetical protein
MLKAKLDRLYLRIVVSVFGAFLAVALPRWVRAAPAGQWFDTDAAATVTVGPPGAHDAPVLRDGWGREVVLRGFNVSGEEKLAENSGLPFASLDDARASAVAMRQLTGSNTIRFPVGWAYSEPTASVINFAYWDQVAEQIGAFVDAGFHVFIDWHQDLYSRYLFNSGSWYTGDGAPPWVIDAGSYPQESCGICLQWGQNMTQNTAVTSAIYDFWHNRVLATMPVT